ncbi:MAG TPA: hypothetical protein VHO26_13850 [Propionibacteriaceae bacterium]|nr:hypothetical protein [Propionibacteriaceae bacterium]
MSTKKRIVVVAAAGLLGLGAAGVYASAMSVSATGGIGAGTAAEQSSCATNVDVHPYGDPVWNATEKTFVYSSLQVSGDFSACVDSANHSYMVQGTVSDATGTAVLNTSVASLNPTDKSVVLTLTSGSWGKTYLPADVDNLTYGIIVRSVAN